MLKQKHVNTQFMESQGRKTRKMNKETGQEDKKKNTGTQEKEETITKRKDFEKRIKNTPMNKHEGRTDTQKGSLNKQKDNSE